MPSMDTTNNPSESDLLSGGIHVDSPDAKGAPKSPVNVSDGSEDIPTEPNSHGTYVVPPHTHNNDDSPRVRQQDLEKRYEYLYVRVEGTSAATAANYGPFFMALAPCYIRAVYEFHETAGTDGGSVGLNIEKLTGTQSPDAGSTILTSNLNLKATANTQQKGSLVVSRASRTLAKGDRLCLKDSGVLTSVAGVLAIIHVEYIT